MYSKERSTLINCRETPGPLTRLSHLNGIFDYFDLPARVKLNACNRALSETVVVKT
jgi:hypothetical protein